MAMFRRSLGCLLLILLPSVAQGASPRPMLQGVNLGLPSASPGALPGKHGTHYLWPTPEEVGIYANWGATALRIPFLWERMQPSLLKPFNPEELALLDAVVKAGAERRVTIVIDVHNFGRYRGQLVGSDEVPAQAFEDFWKRMALHYKKQPYVAFGLMNEPFKQGASDWAGLAQRGIDAIRATGARQLILVPGTRWTGAHSWLAEGSGGSNAEALKNIRDPADNFAFELHQYFDKDSSGTHPECVDADVGVERLRAVTGWLRETGRQGFLGEFGASRSDVCLEALGNVLRYMADNRDVWRGWTYWAAAKWFGNYMFNVYPPDGARFPQAAVLERAMKRP